MTEQRPGSMFRVTHHTKDVGPSSAGLSSSLAPPDNRILLYHGPLHLSLSRYHHIVASRSLKHVCACKGTSCRSMAAVRTVGFYQICPGLDFQPTACIPTRFQQHANNNALRTDQPYCFPNLPRRYRKPVTSRCPSCQFGTFSALRKPPPYWLDWLCSFHPYPT